MLSNIVLTPLELVGKVADHVSDFAIRAGRQTLEGNDTLVKVSQVARVEPITLIDRRAQALPGIADVMQSLNSIFAGYYLQAVNLSMPVGRVNVIKMLDRLSPERLGWSEHLFNAVTPALSEAGVGVESMKLPDFSQKDLGFSFGLEDARAESGGRTPLSANMGKGLSAAASESVNLSVGKMLEVTVQDGGSKAVLPISVRLLATILDPQTLIHILSDNSRDTGFVERWHGWRSGELKFWRDLIFCQDLIDEHRLAGMKDSSNVHQDIMARRRNNAKAALASGIPSAATASNLAVVTTDTIKELERNIGGRFKDYNVRQRVFESTLLMIVAVYDPEWDHVTFYTNGIATATSLSMAEIKSSNKGSGPDVMDILKAYSLGSSPSF
jgi:hypothetical protein